MEPGWGFYMYGESRGWGRMADVSAEMDVQDGKAVTSPECGWPVSATVTVMLQRGPKQSLFLASDLDLRCGAR
jgi:hypothetical protein